MNKWLFLAFLALYLLTASGRIDSADGYVMFQVTDSLMRGEGFAISAVPPAQDALGPNGERIPRETIAGSGAGAFGVDGRYYAQFGVGQSVAAIPFYLFGKVLYSALSFWTESFWTRTAVTLLDIFVTALTVTLVAEIAKLFFDRKAALTLAVVFGLATPAWPYGKTFFSDPLAAGLILWGGYAAIRARRDVRTGWYVLSGAALGAAFLVRPTALLMLPAIGFYLLLACRPSKWQLAAWCGALAVGGTLWLLYNWGRYGNPLMTGYGVEDRWDLPPWIGAYGLLLSPGKGLVWFAPILVLGVVALPAFVRRNVAEGWLLVGAVGMILAGHVSFTFWHGGGGWGPRLILPIVPWLVLPLGVMFERKTRPAWQELGLAFVIAASVLVQVLGTSVNYGRHLQAVYNASGSSEEYFQRSLFRWTDSPIAGQVRELLAVTGNLRHPETRAELYDVVAKAVAQPAPNDRFYDPWADALGLLSFNVPDYWFIYAWLLGAPVWALGPAIVALVCLLVVSAWRLRVVMKQAEA